jgi:DNA-binding NtrC family response regulator
VPALRERRVGLPVLVRYLMQRAALQTGRDLPEIEPQALEILYGYSWPGNIRELQNVIERAVILCKGVITVVDLPDGLRQPALMTDGTAREDVSLRERERSAILEALASCNNNRRLAAEKLGISKRTLQYRLKEYGLVEP